eukprot:Hpha_TRINITY_DN24355_c0_g1::TRINITY_DN24355_c0_g1_i1::g.147992::m.147992
MSGMRALCIVGLAFIATGAADDGEVRELKAKITGLEADLTSVRKELAACRANKPGGLSEEKQKKLAALREEEKRKREEGKQRRAKREEKDAAPKKKAAPEKRKKRKSNPGGVSNEVFCEGCKAVIEIMDKLAERTGKIEDPKRRAAVFAEGMELLCDIKNFPSYNFAPPKMISACQGILGEYEEYLESLYRSGVTKDRFQHFCNDHISACANVDEGSRAAPTVMIDGVPHSVDHEGKINPGDAEL